MEVRIFAAAKERLVEIWDYTEEKWGEAQADKYVSGLIGVLEKAHGARRHWRPIADKSLPGVFFVRYRHHFIFFRELSDGTLGVISILHESMNIPSRLKDDSGQAENE